MGRGECRKVNRKFRRLTQIEILRVVGVEGQSKRAFGRVTAPGGAVSLSESGVGRVFFDDMGVGNGLMGCGVLEKGNAPPGGAALWFFGPGKRAPPFCARLAWRVDVTFVAKTHDEATTPKFGCGCPPALQCSRCCRSCATRVLRRCRPSGHKVRDQVVFADLFCNLLIGRLTAPPPPCRGEGRRKPRPPLRQTNCASPAWQTKRARHAHRGAQLLCQSTCFRKRPCDDNRGLDAGGAV